MMAVALTITIFLATAALVIVTTVLAGPILLPRWGWHAFWVGPALAAAAVQLGIVIVSSWFSFLVSDSDYLNRSIPIGLSLMPWVGLAAFASTAISLQIRRSGPP